MKISTTDSIHGFEVIQHLDVVTDRVVVGAGLVSEFFASFSDAFGGRSNAFEKRINELYLYALGGLKRNAFRIGANGIIGYRTDIEQISTGKGSMFMINAIGTAVVIRKIDKHSKVTEESDLGVGLIARDQIINTKLIREALYPIEGNETNANKLAKIITLIEKSEKLDKYNFERMLGIILEMNDDDDYSTLNKLRELNELGEELNIDAITYEIDDYTINKIIFDLLGSGNSKWTYNGMIIIDKSIESILSLFMITEFKSIIEFMESTHTFNYKIVLELLTNHKDYYNMSDIEDLERILELLKNDHTDVVETKKSVLGSDKWICYNCKHDNSIQRDRCKQCNFNKKGYSIEQTEVMDEAKSCVEDTIISLVELKEIH